MSNGSLVFKYQVGEETPPAEYALPASILKVYGDDHLLLQEEESKLQSSAGSYNAFISPDSGGGSGVEGGGIDSKVWQRANTNGSGGQASYSSVVYSPSSDEEDELVGGSFNEHKSNKPRKSQKRSPPRAPSQGNRSSYGARGESSQSSSHSNSSSLGIPHLLAQTNESPSPNRDRILPYHERKRLLELEQQKEKEEEEKRRRRREEETRRKDNKNMSMKPGSRTSNRLNNGKSSSGTGGRRDTTGRGGTYNNKSEKTPFLNGTKNGYGSNNDIDNTTNSYNSNNNEDHV